MAQSLSQRFWPKDSPYRSLPHPARRGNRTHRVFCNAVFALAGMLALSAAASPVVVLQPVLPEVVREFTSRVRGCQAELVFGADRQVMGYMADSAWLLLQTPERSVELPVFSRNNGSYGVEVTFGGISGALGGRVEGVLTSKGSGKACTAGSLCEEIPSYLVITITADSGEAHRLIDQPVIVKDQCAKDSQKRLFYTPSWFAKLMYFLVLH
jgi:hypothetical protein